MAEIARRLGRAEATIKTYLYGPTGEKARAVKARYRGVCRGCRGAHRATERQGRRVRILQTLPSWRDRAAMDTGTGSRSDARMASALRRCAVLLRLVAHARTPARRRSAQTTTRRRMARTVHCHRSVREPGRQLAPTPSAVPETTGPSMPLIHGPSLCAWPLCERGRRRSPHTPRPFVSAAATRPSALGDCWARGDSDVRLQAAADRAAGKQIDDSRNRGKGGPPTEPDGRARRHAHLWRRAGSVRDARDKRPAFVLGAGMEGVSGMK